MNLSKFCDETYASKVYGCWLGKNAGGTLGEPLEKLFGQEEMFDVWWYPKLLPGGVPNDDLEVQLVFLEVLKNQGIDISSEDLAKQWLKSIIYNYDEYGLHKSNLRLGLKPPVSGWFNNWFKHCMGCPIRSEIWACIAPGRPDIAAKYAYIDGICDHAGGESVYGEIFNAVLESMAFFLSDKVRLVELALESIPSESLTYKAVQIVLNAYLNKVGWKKTRNLVKDALFSPIAQYSPINLGFQTIGLLYGKDFGDAICKAVNCGWDTDCTGATVGAIWGIIEGKDGLPSKWIEPLGNNVVISKGIQNIDAPKTLDALTHQVCDIGQKVIAGYENASLFGENEENLKIIDYFKSCIEKVKYLWNLPPNCLNLASDDDSFDIEVVYNDGPSVLPEKSMRITVKITNKKNTPFSGFVELNSSLSALSTDLKCPTSFSVDAGKDKILEYIFKASLNNLKENVNIQMQIKDNFNGLLGSYIIPLVKSFRWQISEVFTHTNIEPKHFPLKYKKDFTRSGNWKTYSWSDNEIPIEEWFKGNSGTIYLRHYLYSPENRRARIGVPNNCRMVFWLNGKLVKKTKRIVPLRPNYGGDGSNYSQCKLKKGWNIVLIKIIRNDYPIQAHFTIAHEEWAKGMNDLVRYHLPWE